MPPLGLVKGEIWWADLGGLGGHAQAGPRPAIIVAEVPEARSAVVVPMTRTLARTRFPFTFVVEPTARNGLRDRGVALVFQVRYVDRGFLRNKIGNLDKIDVERLDALLADLMKLP